MASAPLKVAIIGSGLSGLSLGLALHQQNIPCTIYESRPAPLNIGGAVMLSPNALKILDALGAYDRIRDKGYNFETLEYQDGAGKVLEVYDFGGKERYRTVLIDELVAMLRDKGVEIVFGKKFSRVVEETESVVSWEFVDGTVESAGILVGADGIHSMVRKYLYPDLKPTFTMRVGITAAVPTKQLKVHVSIPITIQTEHGGFTIAPQEIDGSEVLIGKQKTVTEDYDKAGWDRIHANKDALVKFLQEDTEHFPDIVQNAVSSIPHGKINVWPFYVVPKLDKWASENRRVIILGDAAHAIPPSAGQGVNQAFEDIYILALLLGQADKVKMQDALSYWQSYRQARVDRVLWLNDQIVLRRMSKEEREKTPAGSIEEINLAWLYTADFKGDVNRWVATQAEK